ncbi:MAG: hypothetical protein ACRCZJ_07665 [Erysipelotrichaceae bacterium]
MKKIQKGLLCALLLLAVSGCSSQKKINLNQLQITPEGSNGFGYLAVDFSTVDDHGLAKTIVELGVKSWGSLFNQEEYEKIKKELDALTAFESSLDCTWDRPNGTYSNGDKAVYTCNFDKKAAKKAGYTFTNTKIKFKVSGLAE